MSNSSSNYNGLYLNSFNFGFPVEENELKMKIEKWRNNTIYNIIYTSNISTDIQFVIVDQLLLMTIIEHDGLGIGFVS